MLTLRAGKILNIPIQITTQNAARLGSIVPELANELPKETKVVDKTAFSMVRSPFLPLFFPTRCFRKTLLLQSHIESSSSSLPNPFISAE